MFGALERTSGGQGCFQLASIGLLIEQFRRACSVVSSSTLQSCHSGLVLLLNLARWPFSLLCPVLNLNRILVILLDLCLCHLCIPVFVLSWVLCSSTESSLEIVLLGCELELSWAASLSAISLPSIPMWLGIQKRGQFHCLQDAVAFC
ncbi:hypothetical protein OUZ56_010335 [Daphnia magna]|uniref:Uncharacterized protein n=1 Tax=Daphnia magna TaxID=35525 RepID=A0ABR0AIA6_9CRUS|nr:hypothetical protein OUZ56_010335 [Daphnia magna]